MKAFFKNAGLFVLALIGAVVTFFIGKSVAKSVAKSQEKRPIKVNIPANVREVSRATTLNQVVNESFE